MIEELRREWARWRTTREAWVWPLLVTLAVAGGVLGYRWWRSLPPPAPLVTYSDFLDRLDAGAVASLTVVPGSELHGTWSRAVEGAAPGGEFRVVYPTSEVTPVLERAERAGTPVTLASDDEVGGTFWRQLALIVIVLVAFAIMLRRQLGGGSEMGRLGTGSSRSRTMFSDVAGHEGTVAELRELVEFLKAPAAFRSVGART
ncbi:MAG TPA: hypothetical protein VEB59_00675, partial [Gemmatimonadales bacterium]|nr:hypothetical protein [Gemmatimonadales bacterium]